MNELILVNTCKSQNVSEIGEVSDGYHTFNELYDYRAIYNALAFNEWALDGRYDVHKSKRHYDGEKCFDGEFFVVCAMLPTGQITNHYPMKDWELFRYVPEVDKAKYEWDGHTPQDAYQRMKDLITDGW